MMKMLVIAGAVLAVVSSSAMACSGHKSGGKGGSVTAEAPVSKVIIVAKA